MLLVPVDLRPSPIHEIGVFAREPIPKDTIVWQFDPGIDRRYSVAWLRRQPERVRKFFATYSVLNFKKTHYSIPGDQTLFINHSDTPNLKPKDDVIVNGDGVVAAVRDIAAGEELTVNYGEIDGADRDKLAAGLPLFSAEPAAVPSRVRRKATAD